MQISRLAFGSLEMTLLSVFYKAYCILSLHARGGGVSGGLFASSNTLRTVVPEDGQVAIRKITDLTIAADSRAVPEPYAAKFLAHLANLPENPRALI